MATVPGTPDPPDLIPKELRPTQGDLMIAAGMLHQQGAFKNQQTKLAGDVIPFPPSANTPLGRKQLREELAAGKQKFEASIPKPTLKITPEQLEEKVREKDE